MLQDRIRHGSKRRLAGRTFAFRVYDYDGGCSWTENDFQKDGEGWAGSTGELLLEENHRSNLLD
jgi:hypothetical protein